jgi:TetR/AcrR family transcriptional regulator, fatty acid metabolism regulator protein
MLEKKPTSRQLRANKTRKLIYDVAVKLMDDQGFAGTTIEEISKRAGVSVGTFYHYFKAKEDIFFDIFKKADDYFESVVASDLKKQAEAGASAREQVVQYFVHYAKYNTDRGLENINQLYNSKNQIFSRKGRYMQVLLTDLISRGQASGELSLDLSADEATDFLFISSRGVVFDWCIHNGGYDLVVKMEAYVRRLIPVISAAR